MNSEAFLQQIPLFHSLRSEDIKRLSSAIGTRTLKKGEALFRKGSEGTVLYIIKKGRVKIVLPSRSGDEVIAAIFGETDFFGEMALLGGHIRKATVTAHHASTLLRLTAAAVMDISRQFPEIGEYLNELKKQREGESDNP